MGKLKPLMSSANPNWRTPKKILDLVRDFSGHAPIGLDPCTDDDNPTGARRFLTPRENGLEVDWYQALGAAGGLVYINPPYGRALGDWAEKITHEAMSAEDDIEMIALLPARTDTKWWTCITERATAYCFLRGRLTFEGAPAPAPFPSVLVYWGCLEYEFTALFRQHGWCP